MPESASKKLALVKEIITEGKMEDALHLVKDIEQMENLTPEESLKILAHKANLYSGLKEYAIGLKFAEELYQKSFDDTEIQELVDKHGFLGFYKTSAKTGDGVIEAFNAIIKKLYHKFKALSSEL